MPLPLPNLDDRSFDDLVAEMLSRVPAHTPEWKQPIVGDPGRTLLELQAWLADALLYRINLIPARQKLAFLRLLGIQMRPAQPARTLLALTLDAPATANSRVIPPLTPVRSQPPFETQDEVTVLPLVGAAFRKRPLTSEEQTALGARVGQLRRLFPVADDAPLAPYLTTPVFPAGQPEPGAGLDLIQGTVDHALWFALLEPESLAGQREAILTTLGASLSGGPQYLNLGFAPALALPDFDADSGPVAARRFTVELTTPDPSQPHGVSYRPLTIVADRTQGLTREGVIRLVLPGRASYFAPQNDVRRNLAAGTGDLPPRLDDPQLAARVVAWLRLRPTEELASLPVTWAGLHAIEVEQRITRQGVIVGHGTGQPDQVLTLAEGNLDPASFELQVEESGGHFVRWDRVDDLALATLQQRAYQLDPESGILRLGNEVRGRIAPAGSRLRVGLMRVGGGIAGNLNAGSLRDLSLPNEPGMAIQALQALAARGGSDAETLEQAVERIPSVFRHRDRAVTEADYRQLALTTPGVTVGRVEILPRFKPHQRRFDVPGVVTVLALPARAGVEAPYPRVDRPFREALHAYLEPRKPLGIELYVIGCEYVPIGLTVGIDNPSGRESVLAAVKDALQRYLFALPPHGPQRAGWPLGRTVRRRELEVVVSRIEGVEGVSGPHLFLRRAGAWTRWQQPDGPDQVELPLSPWQLPELLGVVVRAGDAPEEFALPSTSSTNGFAIPVVPDVC